WKHLGSPCEVTFRSTTIDPNEPSLLSGFWLRWRVVSSRCDQVRDFWHVPYMKATDRLFRQPVATGYPLVLAQVLHPGIDVKRLDIQRRVRGIFEHAPVVRTVPPPLRRNDRERVEECLALLQPDTVLDGNQHRPAVSVDLV